MKDDATLIDGVLKKIPNKYLAVIVASKRARAINDGTRPLIKTGATKPTTMALEEVSAGAVGIEPERLAIEAAEKEEEELLPPSDSPVAEEE